MQIIAPTHPTNKIKQLEWNHVDIALLQQVNNKFTHAIDFWLDNIVVGFITKSAVDAAKYFLKGPIGRYII
jgi:hypothetical protein